MPPHLFPLPFLCVQGHALGIVPAPNLLHWPDTMFTSAWGWGATSWSVGKLGRARLHVSVGGCSRQLWGGADGQVASRSIGYDVSHEHGVGWAGWGEGDQLLHECLRQPLRGCPACMAGPPFALPPASGSTMRWVSWTRRATWSDADYPITNSVLKHVPPTGHLAALARPPSQASVPSPPLCRGRRDAVADNSSYMPCRTTWGETLGT